MVLVSSLNETYNHVVSGSSTGKIKTRFVLLERASSPTNDFKQFRREIIESTTVVLTQKGSRR